MKRKNLMPFVMLFAFLGIFSFSTLVSKSSSNDDPRRIINGITNNINKGSFTDTFIQVGKDSTSLPIEYVDNYNQKNNGYSVLFGVSNSPEYSYKESFNYSLATINRSMINSTLSTNGLTFANTTKIELFDENSIIINSLFARVLIDEDSSIDRIDELVGRPLLVAGTELTIAAIYDVTVTSEKNFVTNQLFHNAFGNLFFISNNSFSNLSSPFDFYISLGDNFKMNEINYQYTSGFISPHGLYSFFDPLENKMILADTYVKEAKSNLLEYINYQQLLISILIFSFAFYLYFGSKSYSVPFIDYVFTFMFYFVLFPLFAFFTKHSNITILNKDFYTMKLFDPMFIKTFVISNFVVISILLLITLIYRFNNRTIKEEFTILKDHIKNSFALNMFNNSKKVKSITKPIKKLTKSEKAKKLSFIISMMFVSIFNILMTFSFHLTLKETIMWQKGVFFVFTLLFALQLANIFYKEKVLVNSRNHLIASYISVPLAALIFLVFSLILPANFPLTPAMIVFLILSVLINFIALFFNMKRYKNAEKQTTD